MKRIRHRVIINGVEAQSLYFLLPIHLVKSLTMDLSSTVETNHIPQSQLILVPRRKDYFARRFTYTEYRPRRKAAVKSRTDKSVLSEASQAANRVKHKSLCLSFDPVSKNR